MEIKLSKTYASYFGKPVIDRVDNRIFVMHYFGQCLQCPTCKDECCSYGVDIDIENIQRLQSYTDELEQFSGIDREKWFQRSLTADLDYPGGLFTRIQTEDGHCLFLDTVNRGCIIHRFCMDKSIDYHLLKPIVSCLFPVTFNKGLLQPMLEIEEQSLICQHSGMSLYHGVRGDLKYYFGDEFLEELDQIQKAEIRKLEKKVNY
jgi:hypothetical protein